MSKRNILKVLERADETDITEGRVAYYRYREVCVRLADYWFYPLDQVIAVFAALSPNTDYVGNLRSTVSVLKADKEGIPPERVKVSSYEACKERAFTYLNGVSFLDTVKGKKITSFYQNILNPLDPLPVTIDGHAVNMYRGTPVKLNAVKPFRYEEVAEDFRAVARRTGLVPNQLQAITWLAWKRIHNIRYSPPQLDLFTDRSLDLWRTLREPEDILPYELRP